MNKHPIRNGLVPIGSIAILFSLFAAVAFAGNAESSVTLGMVCIAIAGLFWLIWLTILLTIVVRSIVR
jgi:hypothetical protein